MSDTRARVVAERVERLIRHHPRERIDLVGHSEGGLIGRYYVQKLNGAHRVRHLVTLGTPHRGTPWASSGYLVGRVLPSLRQSPGLAAPTRPRRRRLPRQCTADVHLFAGGPVLPSFIVPLGAWPESASQEHRGGAWRTCRVLVQCQDRVYHPSGARVVGATPRRQISVRLRRVALAGGGDGRRAGSVARSRSVSARSLPRGH